MISLCYLIWPVKSKSGHKFYFKLTSKSLRVYEVLFEKDRTEYKIKYTKWELKNGRLSTGNSSLQLILVAVLMIDNYMKQETSKGDKDVGIFWKTIKK